MEAKRFTASDMRRALQLVREHLGQDAIILSSRTLDQGVEIIATHECQLDDVATIQEETAERELPSVAARKYRELGTSPSREHEAEVSGLQHEQVMLTTKTMSPETQPDRLGKELDSMRSEIEALRDLLSKQIQAAQQNQVAQQARVMEPEVAVESSQKPASVPAPTVQFLPIHLSPAYVEIRRRLELLGMPTSWHDGLLTSVLGNNPSVQVPIKQAWRNLLTQLQTRMRFARHDWVDAGGVFALVGPTGAGKTTTIAKLATRYAMQHGVEQVGLVSIDFNRVGGTQHLRTIAKMLGITLRVASSPDEMIAALRALRTKSPVLIDTSGARPGSDAFTHALECLAVDTRIKCLLTLPATSQYSLMKTQWHSYRHLAKALVITKLDEAIQLGEVMAVVIDSQIPVIYTSSGQNIPEDIDLPLSGGFMSHAVTCIKRRQSFEQQETIAQDATYIGIG